MHPAHRPPPPKLDFEVDGEVIEILATSAHRDATDAAFERILHLERKLQTLGENIEWREAHVRVRAARWVKSRMIFTAVVTSTLLGYALWLRYTDGGRHVRIGLVVGYYENQSLGASLWDEPHWLTADMTTARIRELIAQDDADRARQAAEIVP